MKFPHLPVGQRFNYKGKSYTKTGPLTASEEGTGKSQLIMKSAEVTPLDLHDTPATHRERQFSETEVRAMFANYRRQLCDRLTKQAGQHEGLLLERIIDLINTQESPIG